jgi:hydroxyethylthiazole kinase-like uncharacterized protein yjeF
VLIVGGAPEMPGAMVLSAQAAFRAGAGKVQIATCRSVAPMIGVTVPGARVFALPELSSGGIASSAVPTIAQQAARADVVVIGPGMIDERAITRLLRSLLPRLESPIVIIDAIALVSLPELRDGLARLEGRGIITPHAGEMASILGITKEEVDASRLDVARRAAEELKVVVVLKGVETLIAAPGGKVYRNRSGNVGLAISGSGDTHSGIIAALAARGATPEQAAAWGVYLHGRAGDRMAKRMGRLGYLPGELIAEVPRLMEETGGR